MPSQRINSLDDHSNKSQEKETMSWPKQHCVYPYFLLKKHSLIKYRTFIGYGRSPLKAEHRLSMEDAPVRHPEQVMDVS